MRFGGHGPDPATSNRSTADRRDAIAGFLSAWLILAAWHLGLPAALVTVAAALTYRRAKIWRPPATMGPCASKRRSAS
jgi:hypothetical protein